MHSVLPKILRRYIVQLELSNNSIMCINNIIMNWLETDSCLLLFCASY